MRLGVAFALAFGAGVAGWAAHAPVEAGPLVLLVVPLLLGAIELAELAEDERTPRPVDARGGGVNSARRPSRRGGGILRRGRIATAIGFFAGLVTFLPMLAWLILPAGFAAWVLVSSIQAGWYGLVAYLLRRWVRSGWVVLVAPVLWTGMDAWRGAVPLEDSAGGRSPTPTRRVRRCCRQHA